SSLKGSKSPQFRISHRHFSSARLVAAAAAPPTNIFGWEFACLHAVCGIGVCDRPDCCNKVPDTPNILDRPARLLNSSRLRRWREEATDMRRRVITAILDIRRDRPALSHQDIAGWRR